MAVRFLAEMAALSLAYAVYSYIADAAHYLADKWRHGIVANGGNFHRPCGIMNFLNKPKVSTYLLLSLWIECFDFMASYHAHEPVFLTIEPDLETVVQSPEMVGYWSISRSCS